MKFNEGHKVCLSKLFIRPIALLFSQGKTQAQEGFPGILPTQANPDTEQNMAVVRCYFGQILDSKKVALADQVFAADCIMHRPGVLITGIVNIKGFLSVIPRSFADFKTTFLDMFATGDRVAVRLKHDATYSQDAVAKFRIGKYPVGAMKLSWTANVIFRFKEGKIAEEWVERDELGMLLSLGILKPNP
jgi:predicted ester cyclase